MEKQPLTLSSKPPIVGKLTETWPIDPYDQDRDEVMLQGLEMGMQRKLDRIALQKQQSQPPKTLQ